MSFLFTSNCVRCLIHNKTFYFQSLQQQYVSFTIKLMAQTDVKKVQIVRFDIYVAIELSCVNIGSVDCVRREINVNFCTNLT